MFLKGHFWIIIIFYNTAFQIEQEHCFAGYNLILKLSNIMIAFSF